MQSWPVKQGREGLMQKSVAHPPLQHFPSTPNPIQQHFPFTSAPRSLHPSPLSLRSPQLATGPVSPAPSPSTTHLHDGKVGRRHQRLFVARNRHLQLPPLLVYDPHVAVGLRVVGLDLYRPLVVLERLVILAGVNGVWGSAGGDGVGCTAHMSPTAPDNPHHPHAVASAS